MELQEARNILGDRATWELRNMKKALEMIPFFNTQEEDERLEAVKIELKERNRK